MSTSATKGGRQNKIYRSPPTPPPHQILDKEKGFTLDCVAVSSVSNDYSKANPKFGPVVPPYNSQKDKHPANYFNFHGVEQTLEKTGQAAPGTSIEGPAMDYFQEKGAGNTYLTLRNHFGAALEKPANKVHSKLIT